jgi:hypothetical protein
LILSYTSDGPDLYGASSFFETMPLKAEVTNRSKHLVAVSFGVFHVPEALVMSQKFSQCRLALPVGPAA